MKPDPFEIVGTMLDGRYRIDEVVGEGGFGVVYRAFHPGFDAAIAIKVLKVPHGLKTEERDELLATFHQEGKLLFALSKRSASFVQVMEKGVLQRQGAAVAPYLVLEWLDGKTLDADLRERRARGQAMRSLDEVIALLDPIADALALAHAESKVAHRDIKPENIFLVRGTRGGTTTKLLDFGIAKVMTSTGPAALNDPTLRAVGALTPQYAAPEQWNIKYGHTGPWTDVYALALVCVELLSGSPALRANEPGQFFGATIDPERPTPSQRGVAVSPGVEQVFLKALTVKPEERYRDMQSFWGALKAAAAERGWPSAQATPLPMMDPLATPLALAPTVPASGGQAPPGSGAAWPGSQGAAAMSTPGLAGTIGGPRTAVPGRGAVLAAVAAATFVLVALSTTYLLLREPSSPEGGAAPLVASEMSSADPPPPPEPPSPPEAPGASPPASSGARTASLHATGGSAISEPAGAPAASASASVKAGSNSCHQRADCKDGKKCVRGTCRYAECTDNQDCSGPRSCNLNTNKCEWSLPGF